MHVINKLRILLFIYRLWYRPRLSFCLLSPKCFWGIYRKSSSQMNLTSMDSSTPLTSKLSCTPVTPCNEQRILKLSFSKLNSSSIDDVPTSLIEKLAFNCSFFGSLTGIHTLQKCPYQKKGLVVGVFRLGVWVLWFGFLWFLKWLFSKCYGISLKC